MADRRRAAGRAGDMLTKANPDQRSALHVVLVSMPFMDPYRPSIQLGLLKSLAAGCGFPARTLHANLDFAVRIGMESYELLCQHRGPMVGDWLFSLEAFPRHRARPAGTHDR